MVRTFLYANFNKRYLSLNTSGDVYTVSNQPVGFKIPLHLNVTCCVLNLCSVTHAVLWEFSLYGCQYTYVVNKRWKIK